MVSNKVFLRMRHFSWNLKDDYVSKLGQEGVKGTVDINSMCRGSERVTLECLEESQSGWGVLWLQEIGRVHNEKDLLNFLGF